VDVAAAGGRVAQQIGGRGELRASALNATGAGPDSVHRRIGAAFQVAPQFGLPIATEQKTTLFVGTDVQ